MKYAFVAEHRPIFSSRAMCRCLSVQPGEFYAWLKAPLSRRAQEDHRQTELIRTAWNDSSKVYGYRKIHDDLMDMGESCWRDWRSLRASARRSAIRSASNKYHPPTLPIA